MQCCMRTGLPAPPTSPCPVSISIAPPSDGSSGATPRAAACRLVASWNTCRSAASCIRAGSAPAMLPAPAPWPACRRARRPTLHGMAAPTDPGAKAAALRWLFGRLQASSILLSARRCLPAPPACLLPHVHWPHLHAHLSLQADRRLKQQRQLVGCVRARAARLQRLAHPTRGPGRVAWRDAAAHAVELQRQRACTLARGTHLKQVCSPLTARERRRLRAPGLAVEAHASLPAKRKLGGSVRPALIRAAQQPLLPLLHT